LRQPPGFIESQLTLYDSVRARYCAGAHEEGKQNLLTAGVTALMFAAKMVTELLHKRCAQYFLIVVGQLSPLLSHRFFAKRASHGRGCRGACAKRLLRTAHLMV